jgi:hypothetical protein
MERRHERISRCFLLSHTLIFPSERLLICSLSFLFSIPALTTFLSDTTVCSHEKKLAVSNRAQNFCTSKILCRLVLAVQLHTQHMRGSDASSDVAAHTLEVGLERGDA